MNDTNYRELLDAVEEHNRLRAILNTEGPPNLHPTAADIECASQVNVVGRLSHKYGYAVRETATEVYLVHPRYLAHYDAGLWNETSNKWDEDGVPNYALIPVDWKY